MLLVTETLVKYCGVYLFTVVDPTIYIYMCDSKCFASCTDRKFHLM